MELLEHLISAPNAPLTVTEDEERAARRSLRRQIARLERELSDAFVTAFQMGGPSLVSEGSGQARLLDLGELERVRDDLAEQLAGARTAISLLADQQAEKRLLPRADDARARQVPLLARVDARHRRAGLRCLAGPATSGPDRHADGLVAGQVVLRLSVTVGSRSTFATLTQRRIV